jgi:hypothetical protein
MSKEIAKKPPELDGYDAYEEGVEGEEQQSSGPIRGVLLRFSNEAEWKTREDETLPPELELIAVDIARIVQRWTKDKQPLETIYLEQHQKFPNIEEMNAAAPKKEWITGPDGKPRGPWQAQHIVYLLDPATMNHYSFATGSVGGAIATRDLVEKTRWMRKFRGAAVVPVVTHSDTYMNTKFGGRQRPHFLIKRWIVFGGGGGLPHMAEQPVLAGPTGAAAAATVETPAAKEIPTTTEALDRFGAKTVTPPTRKEEMRDEIPY